jgi:hypothetical protein
MRLPHEASLPGDSRWGGQVRLSGDQNAKDRFENERSGGRIATGVGGAKTGEGGDIVIIDDAHKIEEARSPVMRRRTIDWYDHTISTRLNDPRTGAIVVIGQRLHEEDLFGHLLASGEWEHLCLPAEYEPEHPHLWAADPPLEAGELLWPRALGPASLPSSNASLAPTAPPASSSNGRRPRVEGSSSGNGGAAMNRRRCRDSSGSCSRGTSLLPRLPPSELANRERRHRRFGRRARQLRRPKRDDAKYQRDLLRVPPAYLGDDSDHRPPGHASARPLRHHEHRKLTSD